MNRFKSLFIVLLPALVLISCQKSDIKPGNCVTETALTQPSDETPAVNSRVRNTETPSVPQNPTGDIVGGGDDDRDGGDKKKAGK